MTGRIAGLDLARTLALLGMFAAHVGDAGTRGADTEGWRWLWIADGRPAALFAVLAGVSMGILVARDGNGPRHARVRVAMRGALLLVLGYALVGLHTPVDVVLANLGLMFLTVTPAITWRARWLLVAAGAVWLTGTAVYPTLHSALPGWPVVEKLAGTHYPVVSWTAYVLVGMAVARLDLRVARTRALLLGAGLAAAVVGYGGGLLLGSPPPWSDTDTGPWWASIHPHANTATEMLGNAGLAVAVIGACLAAPAWPLAYALGSMSLTAYVAHLVVIAVVGEDMVWQPSNVALVTLAAALAVGAAVWRRRWGAGPLERAVTWASTLTADALASPGR